MITKEQKAEIVAKHGDKPNDSGKPEVQVALLTARINDLTGHLIENKKDHHSRRGLIKLVNKRRKLLDYLMKNEINRYRDIIKALGLRK
jgi:small subunit ribosomal protein S15